MAGSPSYKIYHPHRKYIGCMKTAEDAAMVVANYPGASIKWDHVILLWIEGQEVQGAGDSYDFVARVCHERLREGQRIALEKARGKVR